MLCSQKTASMKVIFIANLDPYLKDLGIVEESVPSPKRTFSSQSNYEGKRKKPKVDYA